jgi:L-threonylcarbamoyladenylate synthase
MTRVLRVNPEAPEPEAIAQAASVILSGGLVAFPTETVYGLGANALDERAVAGIFRAKERPAYDPLIVHLADAGALDVVAISLPDAALELAAAFWPGPLTLVLSRHPRIPLSVTAGGDTVAVRVPAHRVANALIAAAGVPIAAPSANRFGRVSPTRADHVMADLEGRLDLLLDGGCTTVGLESTVVSLVGEIPTILRPGGVSYEALSDVLGQVLISSGPALEEETALLSPGTSAKHYAPSAQVVLYRGDRSRVLEAMWRDALHHIATGETVGLLLADEDDERLATLPVTIRRMGSLTSLAEIAQQLYGALRALDDVGVTVILARDFGSEGLGLAIRDRLTRAASGRVIEVP